MPPADSTSQDGAVGTTGAESRTTPRRARGKQPGPTVVILVRHGTTTTTGHELPGRAPGLHLSDQGRGQAERVAGRIATLAGAAPPPVPSGNGHDAPGPAAAPGGAARSKATRPRGRKGRSAPSIAAVYASPLDRTRETAAPIGAGLGLDVVIDDGLVELDVGDWTGLELKAARKRKEWATIQRYPSGFTFPGGESFVAMQARIVDTLARLRLAHPGQTVVAVSHADPIRAAVAHAMGTHLDLFQRVVVSPCSMTTIAYGDEGPMVLTVNDTSASGALEPS
jgi:broad specificity phosphatase PhoE